MISVEQAIQIITDEIKNNTISEEISVSDALNYVLFEDVISPIDMPPFRQSAMDGYALNLHDSNEYNLIGEVKAGDHHQPHLKVGEAIRIFTGAPVPDSANAVIMQEKTSVLERSLSIQIEIKTNANIRPLGEQSMKGEIALKKGTKLNPASIAFLATLGIIKVKVFRKPKIAILVTGNELAEPGNLLQHGQIYESNAIMLSTASKQLGYNNLTMHKVNDDYDNTVSSLDTLISEHDVVLVSGGISVGDYDFVGKALNELHVEQLFYKVKQKPGKPLFFGKKDDKLVFALPGNPAAALSCFYIYVLYALELLSGNGNFSLNRTQAISKTDYIKRGDRAQFLKAIYIHGEVEILDGQSSSMLHTFALSNALVYLSETAKSIVKNDQVEVILLPVN